MEIPCEVPVMILPNASLFPQVMLPLYIFEPRYRRMLADALSTHRMFSVAMRKPGTARETPSAVAGLGLIRASVANKDGTSNLVLQGLLRIELEETVQYKPYRVQRIRLVKPIHADSVEVDALVSKIRELVLERLSLGEPIAYPFLHHFVETKGEHKPDATSAKTLVQFTELVMQLPDPEQLADIVTCALLNNPLQRQIILETLELEIRLKHLIHFLMAENQRQRKLPKS
jgi:ATP-dependent Lon protease